ncbi:hypothetical protein [Polyangium aurulentum]|uniref:hypothetical protein n=1 Tax=Polyangium aurulentum TaxID=2567896 RepID=UPI0010AE9675|nr:hypothetical protein [Polyangium aurulentum]UQA62269.1 hypothetical protein E8A73_018070 [Polyangium aurulentum]
MNLRFLVVCEASADFTLCTCLVDRVLRENSDDWLREYLEHSIDHARAWATIDEGRAFLDWHRIAEISDRLGVRPIRGHFDRQRGAPDAIAARKALAIVRHLRDKGERIDAVLLLRDLDDQPQRANGIAQAITEALVFDPDLPVVVGLANPEREAWLLAGFEPCTPQEEALLASCKHDLGLDPRLSAHTLTASHDHDHRSVKRVLRLLTSTRIEREEQCFRDTPLSTLIARGELSGLAAFLRDVGAKLLPLFTRPASAS